MDTEASTFTDKQGRQIVIGGTANDIVAEFNGNEIGRFDFDITEDENSCSFMLTNCHIDSCFRRCGIGIEMIKLAEQWYDNFCIVNHFAEEGASFINYCLHNVLINNHIMISDNRY